jgi:hypothetical protein
MALQKRKRQVGIAANYFGCSPVKQDAV